MTDKQSAVVLAAGTVGNVMEWYDFALYGYFTPVLTKLFFPGQEPLPGLVATLGIFASGYLMRPVGALLFGHIGDTVGRSRALFLSVMLMAGPTFLLGCLPTHAQAGVWAPILLTLLRLLQGLSVGGEYTGSITFLSEQAPAGQSGLFASFAPCGSNIGMLLGSGVGAWLASALTEQQFMAWGWRIPFWSGMGLAVLGILLRARLAVEGGVRRKEAGSRPNPLREVLTVHTGLLLRMIGLTWFLGVSFYITFAFLSTYLTTQTRVPLAISLEINATAMLVLIFLTPLLGHLSDRYGRKPFILAAAVGLAAAAWPVFRILADGDPSDDLAAQMLLAALVSLFNGAYPAMLAEMAPAHVRMTMLSLGYGLGMAIFGGTAPMVATLLIQWTGSLTAPAWYLMFSALLGFVLLLGTRETLRAGQVRSPS